MEYFSTVLNHEFRKLSVTELTVERIVNNNAPEEKFWYIVDGNDSIVGCIGRREYKEICAQNQLLINRRFSYIRAGGDERQTVMDVFAANPGISRVPVVDAEGRILYEYVKSFEAYYEDLEITHGVNLQEKRNEEVIVSLTSYGRRLDKVHIAVKSIMCQTLKADRIILYISEEDSRKHIKGERELIRAGLTIERNVKDLKSHKKYFYVMQKYQQSIIVTIDDDTIYDEHLLEDLYQKHLEYPEAVICRRGHRIVKKNGRIAPYCSWDLCAASTTPEKAMCATGVGGILYPCGEYREAFLDEKGIYKASLYGDDLWLKAVELIYGIRTYALGEWLVRPIKGSQEEALYRENAENQRNDAYLSKLQEYFDVNLADLL